MEIYKNTPEFRGIFIGKALGCLGLSRLGCRKNTLLFKSTDSLGAQHHRHFLTINNKSLLLQVWLENTLGATQREADVVAKLFAFTGKFTSCCHD